MKSSLVKSLMGHKHISTTLLAHNRWGWVAECHCGVVFTTTYDLVKKESVTIEGNVLGLDTDPNRTIWLVCGWARDFTESRAALVATGQYRFDRIRWLQSDEQLRGIRLEMATIVFGKNWFEHDVIRSRTFTMWLNGNGRI